MILHRFSYTPYETWGVLIDTQPFIVTLEPPWEFNVPNKSCIPAGQYECKRVKSDLIKETFKGQQDETFEIQGVPGRDLIRFHPGNLVGETNGCPLTGRRYGELNGQWGLKDSKLGFLDLMARLKGQDTFQLIIRGRPSNG